MNLHNDRDLFADICTTVAENMGQIDPSIVEKDYYVTLFLKRMAQLHPDIIFKGGTSLSKCYKVIKRFSEDIDLSVKTESSRPTQSCRRQLKQDIITVIDENNFTLLNPEKVRSRRDYNRYVIDYKSSRTYLPINQNLIVETTVFIKTFPTNALDAASLIYDFLMEQNYAAEIAQYGIEPFPVNVLSIEGAFAEKVFALVDYYLSGVIETHSRHIYDVYKLFPKIAFDPAFKALVFDIRKVRKAHSAYRSAQDGVDMAELLVKITDDEYYRNDYEKITSALLFENVPYTDAIQVLREIAKSGCF